MRQLHLFLKNQNLPCDCLFISMFLIEFACSVLQFLVHIRQIQSKPQKSTNNCMLRFCLLEKKMWSCLLKLYLELYMFDSKLKKKKTEQLTVFVHVSWKTIKKVKMCSQVVLTLYVPKFQRGEKNSEKWKLDSTVTQPKNYLNQRFA